MMVKCESQISQFCEKKTPKKKVKNIDRLNVCEYCYNKLKKINKKQ